MTNFMMVVRERGQRTRAAARAEPVRPAPARRRHWFASADLAPGDRVYDLGAGTGADHRALLAAGARVVAVERDPNLARKLRARFGGHAG